jgi:hypothetical protein
VGVVFGSRTFTVCLPTLILLGTDPGNGPSNTVRSYTSFVVNSPALTRS